MTKIIKTGFRFYEKVHLGLLILLFIIYVSLVKTIKVSKPRELFENTPLVNTKKVSKTIESFEDAPSTPAEPIPEEDVTCPSTPSPPNCYYNSAMYYYTLNETPGLEIATGIFGFIFGIFLASFVKKFLLNEYGDNIIVIFLIFIISLIFVCLFYAADLYQQGDGGSSWGRYAYFMYPLIGCFLMIGEDSITHFFNWASGDSVYKSIDLKRMTSFYSKSPISTESVSSFDTNFSTDNPISPMSP